MRSVPRFRPFRRSRRLAPGLVLLLLGLLAACRPPLPPAAGQGGSPPLPTATPQPAGAADAAARATAELATRLAIPPEAVTLVSVTAHAWADRASVVCTGVAPAAWLAADSVPGFIVELLAQGQSYTYHVTADQVVFCNPMLMAPPP